MKKKQCRRYFLMSILAFSLQSSLPAQTDNAYIGEIEEWHNKRIADLKKENGFLNLAGLFWLKEGTNTFGSDPSNAIVFPKDKIPAKAGYYIYSDKTVLFVADKHAAIRINDRAVNKEIIFDDDSASNPVLAYGSLRWNIIKRGDRMGIRLHDLENPNLKSFTGIHRYPVNPDWKIKARLLQTLPGKTINILDVLGQTQAQRSPGTLSFDIDGKAYTLDVLEGNHDDYFLIFGDATNGLETYPSGRFIYVPKAGADGTTFIDFNKSYSPPCAFTPYATCPLPPRQNILPVEVRAGEKFESEFGAK
jgi:uncharacterized protein (DUF1684 family)